MSQFQKQFDQAIWKVVSHISTGRVMSYGEVARVAGYPRHARMVSRAMSRSPSELPWHRVVKSDRTLAFAKDSDAYKEQTERLQRDGVKIIKGKVVPVKSDKDKVLDDLLWGPDS